MSAGYVCERCRENAIRTARASLEVLEDVDASKATSDVATEELGRALEVLRHPSGRRVDGER
jgi:hypothetical protein